MESLGGWSSRKNASGVPEWAIQCFQYAARDTSLDLLVLCRRERLASKGQKLLVGLSEKRAPREFSFGL